MIVSYDIRICEGVQRCPLDAAFIDEQSSGCEEDGDVFSVDFFVFGLDEGVVDGHEKCGLEGLGAWPCEVDRFGVVLVSAAHFL